MVPLLPTTVPSKKNRYHWTQQRYHWKKNGCRFFPNSCRSKAILHHDSSPVAPVPSAKTDRSTILVIKNGIRCCRNRCPMGCNGWPVANPLQLSKFSLKLSKLMNPLHFQQRPLNQQRQTTASNGWKNGSATGATSAFNGFSTGTHWKPVLLPFRCHWGILGGWNISAGEP